MAVLQGLENACEFPAASFPLDKQFPHFYLPRGHCLLVSVNDLVTR